MTPKDSLDCREGNGHKETHMHTTTLCDRSLCKDLIHFMNQKSDRSISCSRPESVCIVCQLWLFALCWHYTLHIISYFIHNHSMKLIRTCIVNIVTDTYQYHLYCYQFMSLLYRRAFTVAQLSMQENVGQTIDSNWTNQFSGVNLIKIIFGESECTGPQIISSCYL